MAVDSHVSVAMKRRFILLLMVLWLQTSDGQETLKPMSEELLAKLRVSTAGRIEAEFIAGIVIDAFQKFPTLLSHTSEKFLSFLTLSGGEDHPKPLLEEISLVLAMNSAKEGTMTTTGFHMQVGHMNSTQLKQYGERQDILEKIIYKTVTLVQCDNEYGEKDLAPVIMQLRKFIGAIILIDCNFKPDTIAKFERILITLNSTKLSTYIGKKRMMTLIFYCAGHEKPYAIRTKRTENDVYPVKLYYDITCPHTLNGKHLKISLFGAPPHLETEKDENGNNKGVYLKLMQIIASKYQFTFTFNATNTPDYYDKKLKRFTGRAGDVQEGHADIGLSFQMILEESFTTFGISDWLIHTIASFQTTHIRPKETYWKLFNTYHIYVWAGLSASIVSMTIAVIITYKIYDKLGLKLPSQQRYNIVDAGLATLQSLVEPVFIRMFSHSLPTWSSGKILMFTWSISSMILVLAYQSNLRAAFVNQEYTTPIDTFQKLMEKKVLVFIAIYTPPYMMMKNSKSQTLQKLFAYSVENGGIYEYKQGIPQNVRELMVGSKVAILSTEIWNRFADAPWKSGRYTRPFYSKDILYLTTGHLLVKKESHWIEDINFVIGQIHAKGLVDYYEVQKLPLTLDDKDVFKLEIKDNTDEPVNIEDVFFIGIFWLFGILLSFVTFSYEAIRKHKKRRRGISEY